MNLLFDPAVLFAAPPHAATVCCATTTILRQRKLGEIYGSFGAHDSLRVPCEQSGVAAAAA